MKKHKHKFKDKYGRVLQVGDLFQHGMLAQTWLAKTDKIARIVSDDSGLGYEEDMADLGIGFPENNTIIIGSIARQYKPKS